MKTVNFFVFILLAIVYEVNAQDTTLYFVLYPSESVVKSVTAIPTVSFCDVKDDTCIVTCANSEKTIEKTANKIRLCAIAKSVEHTTNTSAEQAPAEINEPTTPQVTKSTMVSQEKYKPEIDAFLNIEDETIFSTEKFLKLNKEEIHPRSYNRYCLISAIREFAQRMAALDNLGFTQLDEAKKELSNIDSVIDKIFSYEQEIEYLTEKQKNYYGELYKKYEKTLESIKK